MILEYKDEFSIFALMEYKLDYDEYKYMDDEELKELGVFSSYDEDEGWSFSGRIGLLVEGPCYIKSTYVPDIEQKLIKDIKKEIGDSNFNKLQEICDVNIFDCLTDESIENYKKAYIKCLMSSDTVNTYVDLRKDLKSITIRDTDDDDITYIEEIFYDSLKKFARGKSKVSLEEFAEFVYNFTEPYAEEIDAKIIGFMIVNYCFEVSKALHRIGTDLKHILWGYPKPKKV